MERVQGDTAGSIGKLAGRGLRWGLFGNLVTRLGSFAMGLVLARLLAPEDFGLYAVALAATMFVMSIKDVGIMAAVVQWRGRVEDVTPTATLVSFVTAMAMYGLFWVGAPAFSQLAGSEAATPVVRLLTAVILVEGFTAIRSAMLLRRFQQDVLTKAVAAGFVVNAAVAIVLAAEGAGAYSFAWGQVAAAVVTGVIVLFAARMPIRVGFDAPTARSLIAFGIPSAAGVGLESLLQNAGYIVVGNVMGASWLGYFLLAFNVSSWVPGLVGNAIRNVAIPGFSRLAEERPEALSAGVRKAVPLLVTAVLPLAVVMGVLAHPLISFLYGDKWGQSAGVLRWLAIVMVVRMLAALAYDALTSQGATGSTVWMNLGFGIALVPALILGAHLDGIRGAAIGQAAVSLLVVLPLAAFFLRRAGVDLRGTLPELIRPLGAGLLAAGVAALLDRLLVAGDPLVRLCVAGGGALLVYILAAVPVTQLRRLVPSLSKDPR
ncbi:oligosaccharide flippase family protein [Nonomuraea sp. NPDC000554]|uniref:oligosaccharide flippase family protein n=1 Tax=Nonomuraea sp. NPDC000554 TaxID=3154259 RepID=UPI003327D46D